MNLEHQRKYLQKFNEKNKIFKTEKEKQDVINLYKLGLSCNQIAKKYNCSKTPILKILKNIKKRKISEYSNHFSKNQGFGKNHHSWKGGYRSVYDRIRYLKSYWIWRNLILLKDNKHCKKCKTNKNLEVHHKITLKTLVKIQCNKLNKLPIELNQEDLNDKHYYDINNGSTLCKNCHRQYHREYGR